jgi:uncharacterized membrane protein
MSVRCVQGLFTAQTLTRRSASLLLHSVFPYFAPMLLFYLMHLVQVSQADVKLFFESICGEVYRLRLLGDYQHNTRIAFVEFVMAESATAALNCSGVILGSLPIRVSPSKTPVRPRAPRPMMN